VQLVLRTRQGAVATEAGRLLLEHGEAMLGRAALAERQIAELAGLSRGEVRLGSFFTALVYLSAEVGARLDARHPDVTLTDELVDRTTAFRRLASGHLDVAVVFEPAHEPQAGPEEIELVPLFDDPLRVLLPSDHRLSRRKVITFADLAAETWIRPHDGSAARLLDHVLAEHALRPRLIHAGRGDEPVEAQAVVAAGRGVMLSYDLNVIINPHRCPPSPRAAVRAPRSGGRLARPARHRRPGRGRDPPRHRTRALARPMTLDDRRRVAVDPRHVHMCSLVPLPSADDEPVDNGIRCRWAAH
jgi:DNA-binding transcriptional LysR family regulator